MVPITETRVPARNQIGELQQSLNKKKKITWTRRGLQLLPFIIEFRYEIGETPVGSKEP